MEGRPGEGSFFGSWGKILFFLKDDCLDKLILMKALLYTDRMLSHSLFILIGLL